jgi:hypothetical protein
MVPKSQSGGAPIKTVSGKRPMAKVIPVIYEDYLLLKEL